MNYSSVAYTASTQTQTQVVIDPSFGDVSGFAFNLTSTATGTLSSPTPVTRAISQIVVTDNQGKTLLQLQGRDLDKIAFLLSPQGEYTTASNNSNSPVSWNAILPVNIATKHQPAKVQVTFAPYSALASSGATGGTLSLSVDVVYAPTNGLTHQINVVQLALASGSNTYSSSLANLNTLQLGFAVGTESNINYLNFSPDGKVDVYSSQTLQSFIDLDNALMRDGHQTGIFNLWVSPFNYSTSSSRFVVNGAGSDTIYVYQIGSAD